MTEKGADVTVAHDDSARCSGLCALLREAYPETAGVTLGAVAAMAGQETFSRAQVAYLVSIAYATGERLGAGMRDRADVAEMRAVAAEHYEPRATREIRVARRVAEMDRAQEMAALRRGNTVVDDHPGGAAADWDGAPEVAARAAELNAALCRMPKVRA